MKTNIILFISLLVIQLACQKPQEVVDDKPAIKSISFVDVPDRNVHFDAPNSRITVQLPESLTGGLQPVFELTPETKVIHGLTSDNTVDLTPFCHCNSSSQSPKVVLQVSDQKAIATYELIVVSTGSLKAKNSNTPLTFARKSKLLEMNLPVENLYTNPYIDTILFTNLVTGTVSRVYADGACLNTCKATAPNQLVFALRSPIENTLLPGTYSITLGGVTFPQQLTVTD